MIELVLLVAGGTLALGSLFGPRDGRAPVSGAVFWFSILVLRTAFCVVVAFSLALYLPSTWPFTTLAEACLHLAVPLLSIHTGVSGHHIGDLTALGPALLLGLSVILATVGLWRSSALIGRWLEGRSIGHGPLGSVVVNEAEVIVATAGLARPRVLISDAAIQRLDSREVRAGLEHEWGHVKHHHRLVLFASWAMVAVSRLVPGGDLAWRRLKFHLERDADDYAIRRVGDPLALASAICKVAGAPRDGGVMVGLGDSEVRNRLGLLLNRPTPELRRRRMATNVACGSILLVVVALVLAPVPDLAHAAILQAQTSVEQLGHCIG